MGVTTNKDFQRALKDRIAEIDDAAILQQALHWAMVALDVIAHEPMKNEFMRTLFAARCKDVLMEFLCTK